MGKPILERLVDAIEQVVIEYKREKKVQIALASVAKAKERGSHANRPLKRNDAWIAILRDQGRTIRDIAKITGVSPTVVQRSLKQRGKRG